MSESFSNGSVLLIDPNADDLSDVGTALRNRGFSVVFANGARMACDRAASTRFDVVIVAGELAPTADDARLIVEALASEDGDAPPFIIAVRDPESAWGENSVLSDDVDALVARIVDLTAASMSAPPVSAHDKKTVAPPSAQMGSLAQTSLLSIAEGLFIEGKTGTLTITTAKSAGELRFSRGDIVDAVYMRFEGAKALFRALGETDGTFVFTPGTPVVMRRITTSTEELLDGAKRQVDETRRLRAFLGDGASTAFVAIDGSDAASAAERGSQLVELSPLARSLMTRLRAPIVLDEILDATPDADLDLLGALSELDTAGRLKRIRNDSSRHPFIVADQLDLIRALAARAKAAGFVGPARIVVAGAPTRLAILAHAALRLDEAVAPAHPEPIVPAPHAIVTLMISDGIALEIVALPLVPAYAPLWPMALAGAAVVVRLDDAAAALLDEACAAIELTPCDANDLVRAFDEASTDHIGSLVRAALGATETL